jgi:hypothetical protein
MWRATGDDNWTTAAGDGNAAAMDDSPAASSWAPTRRWGRTGASG